MLRGVIVIDCERFCLSRSRIFSYFRFAADGTNKSLTPQHGFVVFTCKAVPPQLHELTRLCSRLTLTGVGTAAYFICLFYACAA